MALMNLHNSMVCFKSSFSYFNSISLFSINWISFQHAWITFKLNFTTCLSWVPFIINKIFPIHNVLIFQVTKVSAKAVNKVWPQNCSNLVVSSFHRMKKWQLLHDSFVNQYTTGTFQLDLEPIECKMVFHSPSLSNNIAHWENLSTLHKFQFVAFQIICRFLQSLSVQVDLKSMIRYRFSSLWSI